MKYEKVPYEHVKSLIDSLRFVYSIVPDTTTTACWAILPNDFQVGYGESACVIAEQFDKALGEKYAKERAITDATNKLWFCEGYLFKVTGKISADFPEKSFAEIHKEYYNSIIE